MAMAATVALPEGLSPETVTVHRDHYRLALDVSIRVERGRTYVFTKYVAASRAGWGGNATDDLALAREARKRGFDRLLEEHRAAWDALWQPDILIEGDAKAQQVAHSELYYLLASATAGTARSEEHTSELQSQSNFVCRLLLEKKNKLLQPTCYLPTVC